MNHINKLNMIVAFCKNRGIGNHNIIPWYIQDDFKQFKNITSREKNSGIVMGKNTWLSLPRKPLKNRENIILSSTLSYSEVKKYDNIKIFSKKDELDYYLAKKKEPSWIIGGENIYNQYMTHKNLNKIFVTYIDKQFECDTFFPELPAHFELKYSSEKKINDDYYYQYQMYKNINI